MESSPPVRIVEAQPAANAPAFNARAVPYAIVAACFFILVVAWSLVIPFHGAPDERTHLYLVEYLYRFGAVPTPGVDPAEPFIGDLSGWPVTKDQFWYFGLPYLNSLGAAGLSALFADILPQNYGYIAARAFNWLLAPVFAVALLVTARAAGLRGALAYLAPVAFLLVPQATFLFSYFNADAFALTVTALSLALLLKALANPRTDTMLFFGLSCGLLVSSKIYFYPALVFFAALIGFQWLTVRCFPIVRLLTLTLVGALAVAIPALGTTYAHFGEFTGIQGQILFTEMHIGDQTTPCFIYCSSALIETQNLLWWLSTASKSFFFGLGWMNVFLPDVAYEVFFFPLVAALFLFSIAISVRELVRVRADGLAALWVPLITVLFWSMSVAVILLNIIGSQSLLPQPQGRYLYVIFPFALFLFASLFGRRRPPYEPDASLRGKLA
ncbi:hypothetical protein [Aureimonas mangrovi]|uniref:hypothetical protein n=1 Tax=Aureimonas mangrovi TaxID=2758041 RepID=UPI00163D6773|nr:hypothetical protein [Aureimonas mangrovi]